MIAIWSALIFTMVGSAFGAEIAWDAKASLNARSYPIGIQAVGSLGLGAPLWGRTDTWKYGFARVGLNAATSAVVNRVGIEAQLHPVSILGFSAGYDTGERSFSPRFLDCAAVECLGRVDRAYLKVQAIGAAGPVVFAFQARSEVLHSYESARPFYDELTLTIGRPSGERVLTLNPILLYRLDDRWSAGGISFYSRALDTGGASHLYGPIASYSRDDRWTFAGGFGINSSPVVHQAMALFFTLQRTFEPSLQIQDLRIRKRVFQGFFKDSRDTRIRSKTCQNGCGEGSQSCFVPGIWMRI